MMIYLFLSIALIRENDRIIFRWTEGQSIETLIIDASLDEEDAAKLEDVCVSKIHKVKPQERLGAFKNLRVSFGKKKCVITRGKFLGVIIEFSFVDAVVKMSIQCGFDKTLFLSFLFP